MAPKLRFPFPDDLPDHLLAGYSKAEGLTGKGMAPSGTRRPLVERALQTEMTEHLGNEWHDPKSP